MKQLAFDFSVALAQTFDNFVAGRNSEVVARLRGLASSNADERLLYLWGPPGSGRSHLVRATLAVLESAGARVARIACDLRTALGESLCAMDAVALDDVERLGDVGQAGLFSIYNALEERGKTFLATGNVAPMQLALRADVVTRLGWGLVYEVHGLTDAEKAQALAEHAAARGFTLHADVSTYLLTHARRDLPALLSMVDALDRYSLQAKRAVTVPLVRELLADVKGETT